MLRRPVNAAVDFYRMGWYGKIKNMLLMVKVREGHLHYQLAGGGPLHGGRIRAAPGRHPGNPREPEGRRNRNPGTVDGQQAKGLPNRLIGPARNSRAGSRHPGTIQPSLEDQQYRASLATSPARNFITC